MKNPCLENHFIYLRKIWTIGNEMKENYKTFFKGFKNHLFPPKAIQLQNRCICLVMYKVRGIKMWEFTFHIKEILDYLDDFPPVLEKSRFTRRKANWARGVCTPPWVTEIAAFKMMWIHRQWHLQTHQFILASGYIQRDIWISGWNHTL